MGRVYPRVCGGTGRCQVWIALPSTKDRSIPACAGEPPGESWSRSTLSSVYPRVCGGTGPSPRRRAAVYQRVRGNPQVTPVDAVYPRVCGGTALARWTRTSFLEGLSPRVRGNLYTVYDRSWLQQVYPRVCGGTSYQLRVGRLGPATGLSPRVRGNRMRPRAAAGSSPGGSIPACAGEPSGSGQLPRRAAERWVYPRVCGGTGNAEHSVCDSSLRSIPACAGEPT